MPRSANPCTALITAALLASAVAFSGAALADDTLPGDGITALRKGFASPMPTADPCILMNTVEASGPAVGIGWIAWESEESVDLSSPDDPHCLNPPTGGAIDGVFVITAENGDEISGVYQGVAQIDFVAAGITALGHYRITGGSGRFEDWDGQGVTTISGNFAPPFDFTGELIAQPKPRARRARNGQR